MHNWPAGTRQIRDLGNGLCEQVITLKTPGDIAAWRAILGEGTDVTPTIKWAPLSITINTRVIGLDPMERDAWLKTFPPSPDTHEPFAKFIPQGTGALLVFGSIALRPGAAVAVAPEAPNVDAMDIKVLRTYAASIGVPGINVTEAKAILLRRVKAKIEADSGSRLSVLQGQLSGKRMAGVGA